MCSPNPLLQSRLIGASMGLSSPPFENREGWGTLIYCAACKKPGGKGGPAGQGTQTPSPAPDLIPAETRTENSHWDWYSERGHFSGIRNYHFCAGDDRALLIFYGAGNAPGGLRLRKNMSTCE